MSFAAIAPRVLHRVLLRQWLACLTAQAPWMLGLLALQWITHLVWQWPMSLVVVTVVLWLAGTAVWIWQRKPDEYDALAAWDKSTQRTEDFAAAWWFEQQSQRSPLQQRHIEAQLQRLATSVPALRKDLPLPLHPLHAAVLALALLPMLFLVKPSISETPLDAATREAIALEAARLVQTPLDPKKIDSLTEKEKAALKALHDQLQAAAAELAKSSSASAREVLGLLDKNARAAEALADQLAASQQDWASRALTAALQQHTDTADLGDATASRKPEDLASAAMVLVSQLRQPLLPPEVLERLDAAFNDCARKAEPVDKERYVGKPVLGAATDLEAGRADEAANKLEALAIQMQDLAKREAAKKELQTLAQRLRDSGNSDPNNTGAGDKANGMKQLQATAQQQNGGAIPKVNQTQANAAQANQNANGVPSPAPGQSQMMQGAMGNMTQAQPGNAQPSQGQSGGQMSGRLQKANGSQPSDPNRPRLIAPIPGQPGNLPPNAMLVAPKMPPPPGGASGMMPFAGARPGAGTADLNAAATQSPEAKQASTVNATAGQDGSSSTRKIEGQSTSEATATQPINEQPLQQVQREEAALDDLPLPANRREHVRRYFMELRKRFEEK